jgi:Carboxypeptidase regulatory-like domain/TonB dependent receptor
MHRVPAFALLLLVSFPFVLHAQSINASLTGRVTDPSKAAIADAQVAAVSASTNARYETTTNASGEYYLANLPPGTYRLEIEKPGFKKLVKPDVLLHVQDALSIDLEMSLGSATEAITVGADVLPVDTASATVSTVIDRTFVEDMPLNGRSFQTLILLTPGVVETSTALNDQGQFSVNGQRADGNYFTVDGVSANFGVTGFFPLLQSAGGALPALTAWGGTNSLVSVDALQEFRIQTSSFAPEFGRTPGGQISIVTRSGTNQFHGTLFEYFRNDVLDAKDWFANFKHLPKPADRQNDFGGVVGGPVFKEKTFFFVSYEGLRLRQPVTQQTTVPCDATCSVFGDARAMAPAKMQPFLKAYSIPNGPEIFCTPNVNGCPASGLTGLAQFSASYSNPSSLDAYSIRMDHIINSKLSLFGRYNYSPTSLNQRAAPFTLTALNTTDFVDSSIQTFTLGITQLVSPAISNEVRANYSNQRLGSDFDLDDFGGAAPPPNALLFPPGFSPTDSAFLFLISGVGEYGEGKSATDEQRQINLIDNLSVTKGSHQLKLGVDYRWLAPFSSPFAYRQFAQFLGVACPSMPRACTGYALSGTAPGATSTTAAFAQPATFQATALLSQNFSVYGQDTWKITPRFTVTYGVRWDINPSVKGKNAGSDPITVTGLNDPATMALAPRGTPLYDTTYGNVAPRVGAAYQLRQAGNWGTVLRGGFGIFYDLGSGSLVGGSGSFPYEATRSLAFAAFPLSPQDAAPPVLTTGPPISNILVADPHLKLPRTYQWNVALEQTLGSSQSLSLTYIGATGRDLLRVTNLFITPQVNQNFQFVSITNNTATSDYHALQLKFQRRLSRGLQALASYSFSHSTDIASTDSSANTVNTPGSLADPHIDRGDSDFDIRHSFTAGVTYDLPSPRSHKAVRAAFGGWSVASFILARSAPPVDVVAGTFFAGGVALNPRPNVVPGVPLELFGSQYPGGKIFNKAAFCYSTCGASDQQGDFGRNVLRGFGATQADVALQRQFHFTEQVRLRFRAEFFNIFNHPNFGNPNNSLPSSFFGHSTQTLASSLGSGGANGGFNPLYQIGGPRSIQLALKLQF